MNTTVEREGRARIRLTDRLAHALDMCTVRYCRWKSNEPLLEDLDGETDLDLLVDRADCGCFLKVLTDLGFRKVLSQPQATYIAVENWIGFCDDTGILLHLHVHYELVTGLEFVKEYAFPWKGYVLETAVREPETGFLTIDPHVEMILLILSLGVKVELRKLLAARMNRSRPYGEPVEKELAALRERISSEEMDIFLEEMFEEQSNLKVLLKDFAFRPALDARALLAVRGAIQWELRTSRRYGWLTAAHRSLRGSLILRKSLMMENLGFRVMRKNRFETGGAVIAIIGKAGLERCDLVLDLVRWLKRKMDVQCYAITESAKLQPVEETRKMRRNGGIVILEGSPDVPEIILKEDARKSGRRAPYGLRVVPDAREREEILERKLSVFHPDIVIKLTYAEDIKPSRTVGKPLQEKTALDEGSPAARTRRHEAPKVYELDAERPLEEVIREARRIIWQNF